MVQWINVLWNNSFMNPMRLPLLCRNSRAVALSELGLTSGWLAGWQTKCGEISNFKVHCRSNF